MIWPQRKVNELCEFCIDCVNKTAPSVDYETPFKMIRTTNVKAGFIDVDSVRFVSEDTFEKWTRRSRPLFGDVVLTREAPVGEVGRCTFRDEQIMLGQRLFHYRPDPNRLDWNFLAYMLQSPNIQASVHGKSFGSTVPHIKVGVAEDLEIPCPSVDIQRRLGGILAAYDDLIENNQRRIKLLEESARLLYREWFVQLRFPGHERVKVKDGVPEGWERSVLEDALVLQRGFDLPHSVRCEGDVPVYASTGVVGYHNEAMAKGPGVVTGRSGTLGRVHYIEEDYWPLNTSLWVKQFKRVTPLYGYFVLSALDLSQYNSGASVPTLDRKVVHQLQVLIPARGVLKTFDEMAQPLFSHVRALSHQIEKLKQARDALLPKLMSGALQV